MELEKLKKEVDLLGYIVSTGGQVKRVGADTYRLDPCPVCGRKEHFTINTAGNYYKSFSECCKGGSIIDYMMEVEGMSLKDATERLQARAGGNKGQTLREQNEGNTEQYNGIDKKEAAYLIETAGKNTCNYYNTRGLSEDIIKQYNLGHLPDGFDEPGYGPEFKYVLPVSDNLIILHSDNGQVKYKNYGKADLLNSGYLQDPEIREIYITEGMFDALSLERLEFLCQRTEQVDVEAAAQTLVRRHHHETHPADHPLLHEHRAVLRIGAGKVTHHLADARGIGSPCGHPRLGPAHLRGRHHLHCLGDLLRVAHAADLGADFLANCHE